MLVPTKPAYTVQLAMADMRRSASLLSANVRRIVEAAEVGTRFFLSIFHAKARVLNNYGGVYL